MTKKEISAKYELFIKNHRAEDFKTVKSAISQMWDYVRSGVPKERRRVMTYTQFVMDIQISNWWSKGAKPWTEKDILDGLDIGKVTYGWIGWSNGMGKSGGFHYEEVIERLAEWSFKYNIIGVEQQPGKLCVWVKESTDYQSNITVDVIDKIAKCLEF